METTLPTSMADHRDQPNPIQANLATIGIAPTTVEVSATITGTSSPTPVPEENSPTHTMFTLLDPIRGILGGIE